VFAILPEFDCDGGTTGMMLFDRGVPDNRRLEELV
jgi:hypothetical protein